MNELKQPEGGEGPAKVGRGQQRWGGDSKGGEGTAKVGESIDNRESLLSMGRVPNLLQRRWCNHHL